MVLAASPRSSMSISPWDTDRPLRPGPERSRSDLGHSTFLHTTSPLLDATLRFHNARQSYSDLEQATVQPSPQHSSPPSPHTHHHHYHYPPPPPSYLTSSQLPYTAYTFSASRSPPPLDPQPTSAAASLFDVPPDTSNSVLPEVIFASRSATPPPPPPPPLFTTVRPTRHSPPPPSSRMPRSSPTPPPPRGVRPPSSPDSESSSSSCRRSSRSPRSSREKSTVTSTTSSSRPRGYPQPLGHGNGFPVLSTGQFLHGESRTYVLHPSANPRFRTYDIEDKSATSLFRIVPTPLCLRETKTMLDIRKGRHRAPVLMRAHTIVFTTRSSVMVNDDDGNLLLYLQKVSIVHSKRVIRGYIGGKGTEKAQLIIREEEKGRSYALNDARANEIAHLQRFRTSAHPDKKRRYAFKLHISPGYDSALFIMCAALLLDIWDD